MNLVDRPFFSIGAMSAGGGDRSLPITEKDSFPKQWAAATSKARFGTCKCSRRAGKTDGAAKLRTAKLCQESPGARVLYINLTALNAAQQFFNPLQETLKAKHIPFRADNANHLLYCSNGSFVRAMGCDNVGEVKTKLGDKWDLIIPDEMQSYSDDVLYDLIDRAALPTLVDRGGSLWCLGTPAPTHAGYWYNLYTKSPFEHHTWTLFDNPYIQHDIDTILQARGLKLTDAIVRREYFGEDVIDPADMVFCYEAGRNDIPADGRPEPNHPAWRYAVGLDLGFSDNDAIVVLGWRMDDKHKRLWECESWQKNHLDYQKLAEKFRAVVEKWQPVEMCIDTGGHGARKIAESLKAMLSIYRCRLKPTSVADSIALMNDDFRTGRLLVDPKGLISHDASLVVWKSDKRGVEISNTFHSDIMAAARYAHSCAYHFMAEAPPKGDEDEDGESTEDRRVRQWMERRAVEQDPYNPYREY